METRSGLTPKQYIFNCLKVVGFIIWAILPLNFSFALNLTQEITPVFLRWILAGLWILFTFFSIRWIWRYYLRLFPDPMPKMGGKDIGIAIGLFLFLRIVAIVGTTLNQQIYGNVMSSNDAALQSGNPLSVFPIYFLLFNLTIGIFAPILEELVFRGIFTHLLFSERAKWLPAIITSTVFSLLHGMDNIITFSMYFIMGITFFFAYRRRMAIKDAILVHILNNILAMILSIVTYVMYYFQLI
ncbi:CPBP family intramembrane glutamic endopeptidase [Jeotgalibaca caeni]|uniref:CPBP family intramembrane glutamic endopeptidase n=1 Tax=Jeotgalibaca caeni TaxID=3028623 RepID=UPI00237DFF3A|nr:type II CAAX endopeptidase family protein [Jeotgalibaca caeni]MDE1549287.1 type II CAAX endopeptidase family protein [Jeotgalibaca caeni]